ncbi:LLM class flavin-dependent oxidoreductase, partial [Cryobacterium sp. RTC2.1]
MRLRIFTEPQQGASYDDILAVAQATEALGFDAFFRSDHYMVMGDGGGLPGPTDAWTTLAGLARETSRIRLGTLVSSVTYRAPGILAIQVAQVDQMSGGRVELGLGTGWFEKEHLAYGIPFPAKRFGMLEEQLEIVTGLWETPVGDRYDFTGEHYTLVDSP